MQNMTRQEAVPRWLRPVPEPPTPLQLSKAQTIAAVGGGLVVLGLILMVSPAGLGIGFLGFLALVLGIWIAVVQLKDMSAKRTTYRQLRAEYERLYALAMPKPTDQQMWAWLHESIAAITQHGFHRLNLVEGDLAGASGLNKGQQPLIVIGVPEGFRVQSRRDAEGEALFSHYEVTILYLTPQKLCAYQSQLDLATGASLGDGTHEFFYQHINTLTTKSDRVTLSQAPTPPQLPPGRLQPVPGQQAAPVAPFWIDGSDQGRAWHITTKQLMEIGVAGDRISVVVGIESANQFGTTDPLAPQMRSQAERALAEIRRALHAYGQRNVGGVGAAEQF